MTDNYCANGDQYHVNSQALQILRLPAPGENIRLLWKLVIMLIPWDSIAHVRSIQQQAALDPFPILTL